MKRFTSTRNQQEPVGFYQAIVQGIGRDGGLLVPDFELPQMDLERLAGLDYVQLATEIVSAFVPEDGRELIGQACMSAYGKGLFPKEVVPVRKAGDAWIAELFHGQTAAFKDMALSLLPHLMTLSLRQLGENRKVVILAATSGDTGKAALEGFRDVNGTGIMVFYPTDGVSAIQKQQMVSQEGSNVQVVGIRGNFDDAQRAVKAAFADPEIAAACDKGGVFLSSANSINIGRLIPQIVYYISSYLEIARRGEISLGDKVNFCVPSGNFGNCLAGWMAKQMGLPVGRFLVASNKNNILTDFFNTGRYDANREFYKTNAPAMDILVSSNLERLVWFMTGKDGDRTRTYMEGLKEKGVYEVEPDVLARIQEEFSAGYLTEEQVLETIRDCYGKTGYVLDTHTACAYGFLGRYRRESGNVTPTIVISTASPYKFPESVHGAISGETLDVYSAIQALEAGTMVPVPAPLQGIKDRPVLHRTVIDKEDIAEFIKDSVRK